MEWDISRSMGFHLFHFLVFYFYSYTTIWYFRFSIIWLYFSQLQKCIANFLSSLFGILCFLLCHIFYLSRYLVFYLSRYLVFFLSHNLVFNFYSYPTIKVPPPPWIIGMVSSCYLVFYLYLCLVLDFYSYPAKRFFPLTNWNFLFLLSCILLIPLSGIWLSFVFQHPLFCFS